jgi:ribosomal protein S14
MNVKGNSRIFVVGTLVTLYDLMVNPNILFITHVHHYLTLLGEELKGGGTAQSAQHVIDEFEAIKGHLNSVNVITGIWGSDLQGTFPETIKERGLAYRASQLTKNEIFLDSLNGLKAHCYALIKAFDTECRGNVFLILDPSKAHYFLDEKPFGKLVYDSFEDFREDIENASKCLAYGQHGAAIYHALGVMEQCIRLLGKKTRVPGFKNKDWGGLQSEIDMRNKAWKPRTPKQTIIRDKISGVLTHFYNANKAYRIYIAHKKTPYKEDEAIRIYNMVKDSVRGFVEISKLQIPRGYGA